MTGKQLRRIREQAGLTQKDWGHALGYSRDGDIYAIMSRLEAKERVPERTARLANMFARFGVPERFD